MPEDSKYARAIGSKSGFGPHLGHRFSDLSGYSRKGSRSCIYLWEACLYL